MCVRERPDARHRAARCVIAGAPPAPRAHAAAALACDQTQSNAPTEARGKERSARKQQQARDTKNSSTQERINKALHHGHVMALRSVRSLRSSCREATKFLAPYIALCTSQTLITYVLPIHPLLKLPRQSPAPHCAKGPRHGNRKRWNIKVMPDCCCPAFSFTAYSTL